MPEETSGRSPLEPTPGKPVIIAFDPSLYRRWGQWLKVALGIALFIWLASLVSEIWLPLAIAFLIAMVLDPIVDRMERRGWHRAWAALLIFVAFFIAVGSALYFAVPAIAHQAGEISGQISQYIPVPGNQVRAERSLTHMMDKIHAPAYVRMAVARGTSQFSSTISRSVGWLGQHIMEVLSNLIWVVIIPVVSFYALKDFHLIFAKALLLVPARHRDFVQTVTAEVTGIFGQFIRSLALLSLMNGVATWLLLWALGVRNAFTLGAIAGLFYSVPYVGPILTIVLVAGVSFVQSGVTHMLIVVGANILLHQVIFDQIISPRFYGGHIGLHPIFIIVAILAGNLLLGIVGMLLAVPVAASIQMIILTLVPKLSRRIDLPEAREVEEVNQKAGADILGVKPEKPDLTEQLHKTVGEAVDQVEAREQQAEKEVRQ